jgi:hypothetical protein
MEKVSDLTLAPEKFQYKPDSDMETGKTKGAKPEESLETNPVSVWINPETGEKTVIEGHNRFNEAKNKGQEEVPVKYIKADSEEDALTKAAYENVKKGEMTGITKTNRGYMINKTGTEFDEEGNLLNKSIYPNTIGISQASQEKRASEFGGEAPERGEGITKEEAVQRGRDLISKGADPEKIADDFKKDGKISADALSIVRAKHEELARQTNQAVDKFGENSPEAKEAFNKENQWLKENVKPMQTEWAKIGETQQGEVDIDTGTVMGLQRAFTGRTGKDFTEKQTKQAKELSDKVRMLTEERDNLQKKLTDAVNKAVNKDSKSIKNIKERSKEIADIIRKGKLSRPGVFSAATPASLVWDGAIEIAAKTIEAGGDIAQAIADGLEHIKNSEWYKSFDKKDEAEKAFTDFVNKSHDGDLFTKFVDKKDNKFTPDEVRDIWGYAKREYLDKGMDYYDMLSGVSKDLGLTSEQVRRSISQPKGSKVITNEMYKVQRRRNDAVNAAKYWVKSADTPKAIRFLKALPRFLFGLKVFGHGTVFGATHAGMNVFMPSTWKIFFPAYFRQFKFAYGKLADYEKAMEDLTLRPNFISWKRAGLAVDPIKIYDDYQTFGKYFGKIGMAGDRGFNSWKIFRYDLAEHIYNGLSNAEKADPNTSKEIAKIVNHATGTTNVILPNALNVAFFAPRLEASRWARLITEPTKAIKTFATWNKSMPADKAAAKVIAKRAGEMIGTLGALLAANQAVLSLSGSKHNINFTDPTESDWLKFKAGDKTIDHTGGILSTMTFIGRLMQASLQSQKDLGMDRKRINKIERIVGNYARGKFSPFASTITDLATQSDFAGRPLPFSKDKPPEGETRYTWGQYILQQQTPIPLAEGVQDVIRSMKEKGLTDVHAKQIMEGAFMFVVAGGTGAKIGIAPSQTTEERKATAPGKLRVKTFIKNNDPNKLLKPKTVSDYTDLLHKFSQFENTSSEVKKTMDKLEKPEDIEKYLKGKKLDKDFVFLSNNSPEISSLKTVINYYKTLGLKEQKPMVKIIERNIKNLLDVYKKNQRVKPEDQELFELDDDAKELYENASQKHKEKETKKKEVVSELQ